MQHSVTAFTRRYSWLRFHWLIPTLLSLWLGLSQASAQLLGPPTVTEVTALSGQTRLSPIFGGVTLSSSGEYFAIGSRASVPQFTPATVRGWKSTDAINWTFALPSNDDSKVVPVLGLNGSRLFVTTDNGAIYSLDAQTPDPLAPTALRVKWTVSLGAGVRSQVALSPDHSILYVRTINGLLYALRTSDALAAGQTRALWSAPATLSDGLPPAQGEHTYTQNSPPVVVDDGTSPGRVYLATANGKVLGYRTSGTSPVPVLNLNLSTQPALIALFQQGGHFGTPSATVEASMAVGTNGWLYVGTRNFGTVGAFQVLAAVDPASASMKWVSSIGTQDGAQTLGMIAAPVLDRAGYVYASDFGHQIEQLDAITGAKRRVWTDFIITGKLCQTPALTEDGLLIVAGSSAGTFGKADLVAVRSNGALGAWDPGSSQWASLGDDPPLWAVKADVLETSGVCDFFGAPAISSSGMIYLADTRGRILKVQGTTPLMEGPWPTLGGGNRHSGTPLNYTWSITRIFPMGSSSGSPIMTVYNIDNANRCLGYSYGNYMGSYASYAATFWNPLYPALIAKPQSPYHAEALNSNTRGDVVGRDLQLSQAAYWPQGIYRPKTDRQLLTVPSGRDANGQSFAVLASAAIGIDEAGNIIGNIYGSSASGLIRWQADDLQNPRPITPPVGNAANCLGVTARGMTFGRARFSQGSPAYHAFRIESTDLRINSFADLGTLADTAFAKNPNLTSEALSARDDLGIVGRSQNSSGIMRGFLVKYFYDVMTDQLTTPNLSAVNELPGSAGSTSVSSSAAYGVDRVGTIVGTAQDALGQNRAVKWEGVPTNPGSSQITDLNTWLSPYSGWVLQCATGISEEGFIVGYGTFAGSPAWFMLYPSRGGN